MSYKIIHTQLARNELQDPIATTVQLFWGPWFTSLAEILHYDELLNTYGVTVCVLSIMFGEVFSSLYLHLFTAF